jgi:penicillin amidase
MIRQSFRLALQSIDNEPESTAWGDRHKVAFTHPVFKYVPLVAKLSTLTAATSGGYDTLNRGSYATDASGSFFPHVHGAGYRAVYDLSGTELASVVIGTGQSGNPASGMYRNLFSRWLSDERLEYSTLPGSFAADPHQTLVLTAK